MFNRKQKEIDKLNARCVELARMVKTQERNNYEIVKENEKLSNENKGTKDTLQRINQLMTSNQYNNSKALKNKIIELTTDYQSIS